MERGYVKLWRKTLDSGLLQHPTAWQVFGYLLLMANSKPHRRIIAGVMTEAKPGEIVTGRERLADELGLSVQQIRTALNLLKKLEIVTIKSTNKYSIISLVNWDRYQQQEPAGQPAKQPAGQPAPNQRLTTEQDIKNINTPVTSLRSVTVPKGDTPTPKKKAGRTIFRPPTLKEVEAYCRERGNAVDAGKWWDFYASKGWMVGKNRMTDWKAAVRTWEAKRKAEAQPLPVRRSAEEERRAHNDAVCQRAYERWTGRQEQGVFDV